MHLHTATGLPLHGVDDQHACMWMPNNMASDRWLERCCAEDTCKFMAAEAHALQRLVLMSPTQLKSVLAAGLVMHTTHVCLDI